MRALQLGAGFKAQVAHAGVLLVAVGVGLVNGGGAALCAAGLDAGLDAQLALSLALGLGGGLPGLVLAGDRGVAARTKALGQSGGGGEDTQCQQKGNTARKIHQFRISSTGVRKQACTQLPPIGIKPP